MKVEYSYLRGGEKDLENKIQLIAGTLSRKKQKGVANIL